MMAARGLVCSLKAQREFFNSELESSDSAASRSPEEYETVPEKGAAEEHETVPEWGDTRSDDAWAEAAVAVADTPAPPWYPPPKRARKGGGGW